MNLQEARQISNAESAAYDEMMKACNEWTDLNDDRQVQAFDETKEKWHQAIQTLNQAVMDHPDAFAFVRATWK